MDFFYTQNKFAIQIEMRICCECFYNSFFTHVFDFKLDRLVHILHTDTNLM